MQNSLFPDLDDPASGAGIAATTPTPELVELAGALPDRLHFGTSSWNYPGWAGLVWDREYPAATLSRYGLPAYASHPLLRTVSVDRGFYRPLDAGLFAEHAAQVPDHFRFMVKAPSQVTDPLRRDDAGRGQQPNDDFLNPEVARQSFIEPALEGLGDKTGALVFQISPLPGALLAQMPALIERLGAMLAALPRVSSRAPDAVVAVEVRNPQWLTPQFAAVLAEHGATYCLGLQAKMPPIADQLPVLRALWPGPLVCRWTLHARHGPFGYENARRQYLPFNRLMDPDLDTRTALARVIAGTVGAGQNAWVALGNKAEGSAPLSIVELARTVRNLL